MSESWAAALSLPAKHEGLYERTLAQMRDLLAETNRQGGDGALDQRYDAADVRRLLNHFLMLEHNLFTAHVAEAQSELEDITEWHDAAEDDTERQQLEILLAMSELEFHEAIERTIVAAGWTSLAHSVLARLARDDAIHPAA